MQTNPTPPKNGFTLIELLVVISIIALLASIAVPTGNIVMRKARETQARAVMQGLISSIKGYQTEYNRLPSNTAGNYPSTDDTDIKTEADCLVLKTLMAKANDSDAKKMNPREVPFFEPPVAKGGRGGLASDGGLYDPFSSAGSHGPQPYHIGLDYDGDNNLQNPLAQISGEPDHIATTVIVYSDGADGIAGTKDDLRSWH